MQIFFRLFIFLLTFWLFSYSAASAADEITESFISLALQGDLSSAMELFSNEPGMAESPSGAELKNQFMSRFIDRTENLSPETGDALIDSIVSVYREYWVQGLMSPASKEKNEDYLQLTLGRIVSQHPVPEPQDEYASVFDRVGHIFQAKGFFYLDTPASPLRDLFLWKQEENKSYAVRLTDGNQPVEVTFMSELYSLGWKEFATLGLVSTTGWVEGTRLYCVNWAYDRNSENFRVSYLKHEGRHLADFQRFPGLSSADMEYRAKLTELAFASTSLHRLLEDFTAKSAPNRLSPHTYANYRVVQDVYRSLYSRPPPVNGNPWVNVSAAKVARSAKELLRRNTESLQSVDR